MVATGDLKKSQSFRLLADGSRKPYGVNHVQAAKLIQAALRGFWSRKNLEKLQAVWKQHIELAKHASTKLATNHARAASPALISATAQNYAKFGQSVRFSSVRTVSC